MYHDRLLALGASEGVLSSIEREVAGTIERATEFAKAGAEPEEGALLSEVYADGGSRWRN